MMKEGRDIREQFVSDSKANLIVRLDNFVDDVMADSVVFFDTENQVSLNGTWVPDEENTDIVFKVQKFLGLLSS